MPTARRHFFFCLASALSYTACGSAFASETDWPEQMVAFEALQPLVPFRLRVPGLVGQGRVEGPSVVKAHIDEAGAVRRVALLESCGNGDLDEAAILGLRDMRFQPYLHNGVPTAVTLLLPVHIPKRLGRRD